VTSPTLRGSAEPLSTAYDTALLDLDGVVYIGEDPVPRAAEEIAAARERGMTIAFVTNNASRTAETIAAHLGRLGVAASATEVVTSSMAAAHLLTTVIAPGSTVLVVGGEGLHAAVRQRGFAATDTDGPDVAAAVQGYGAQVSWHSLAEITLAVRRGVPWIATNLDTTLPSPRGLLPGNGALVAAVTTATGQRPVSAGKPELPLHEEALRRTGAERPLVVGDRLDTDIEAAVRARCDSLLVFTGVTSPRDLLTAPANARPTYLARDLGGLNSSHPTVDLRGQVATCGAWRAERTSDAIEIKRKGENADLVDALRAIVAAAWTKPGPRLSVTGDAAVLDAFDLG
jgi:glycerol 3-phosphatase-2